MTDIQARLAGLVQELTDSGELRDPAWQQVFRSVSRHIFVPYYFAQSRDRRGWVLVEEPSPEWLDSVYSNRPLVTQLDGDETKTEAARRGQPVTGVSSTSSSSQPSLMALMLEALEVTDGCRVLEIGTGGGYNAALLCERLGSRQVTSVDIDPELVEPARARLAANGYSPTLAAVDGAGGYPPGAPYDRIIATVALRGVPPALIEQIRPGGVILLPLDRYNRGGLLARLTVAANGRAQGRFLPDFGGFMPVRAEDRHHAADRAFREVGEDEGELRRTHLPVETITDEASPFEFFAALTVPGGGWDHLGFIPDDGSPAETWVAQEDGSWVCHLTDAEGRHLVRQGGQRRLWDEVETAHAAWSDLGEPPRERFGIIATHTECYVWYEHPESQHRWPLD